jgi:hypothetical protein
MAEARAQRAEEARYRRLCGPVTVTRLPAASAAVPRRPRWQPERWRDPARLLSPAGDDLPDWMTT